VAGVDPGRRITAATSTTATCGSFSSSSTQVSSPVRRWPRVSA